MFRRKHAPHQKRIDGLIGSGTVVRGDIVFAGGLRIDGTVQGNVATANNDAGTLVVSERASVDGEINVSHVLISGTVRGPITASGLLELQAKARVVGDVKYGKLEMHKGAVVQGRLTHDEPESAAVVELKRASKD